MTPLDHALALARKGITIFPCRNLPGDPAHKAPLTSNGFKDASTDEGIIRGWWRCQPASLVGAVARKFCALDVDLQHPEAQAWLDQYGDKIPVTRTHRTQRGGLHFIFHPHVEVGCTVSAIAPHIDTRGQGKGYAIWWPAHGFEVTHPDTLAVVPEWIIAALRPIKRVVLSSASSTPGDTSRLRGLVRSVAGAPEGQRNQTLFWAACRAGEEVTAGNVSDTFAAEVLIEAAANAGLPMTEARRTVRSGLRTTGSRP